MRVNSFLRLASLAGAIVAVPSLASAQLGGGVIVTPYVGAYMPTNHVAKTGVTSQGTSLPVDAKQQIGAAFGANVSYWINNHLAIEGGAAYSDSHLKSTSYVIDFAGTIPPITQTENAHVWLGSAKVMTQLMPDESAFNMRFGIGPAIISHGGTAYKGDSDGKITGLTDYGAAVSLCTRIAFTPSVAMRLRAENYMYYSKMGWKSSIAPSEDLTFDSRLQHDFVLSAGLQLFLNR